MLELWQREEYLHDGVKVARVAQVDHASVARAIARGELLPRLLDDAPLPYTHVHVYLQLSHRNIRLQHMKEGEVVEGEVVEGSKEDEGEEREEARDRRGREVRVGEGER